MKTEVFMINLPETFQEKMKELFKDEYEQYINSFKEGPYHGLRVNTSKISVEDFKKICPFQLIPVPWTSNGFYYKEERPSKHPFYHAGLYYLQEPSAMTPASLLPIEKGDLVLDTCAAPGGKSTELGSKLNGTGVLFTNDISASRAQALLKNIELFGISNSYVCSEDIPKLATYFPNFFDKILIDAPCSGEGMFRKEPSIIKSWEERGNQYYVEIQKKIVENALKMLKPGGMISYSTCTFSKSENEDIIEYMLSICPELIVKKLDTYGNFVNGLTENTKNCKRIYPHKVHGEGHFVAILQKGKLEKDYKKNNIVIETKYPGFNEDVDSFMKNIHKKWENGSFVLKKDKLYFVPDLSINLKGLRLLRTGLLIGECKKNRFEPSQALALALKKDEFKQTLSLSVEDERILKYLKGETIDVRDLDTKSKGWILICVEDFPLGFGKISNGTIKNKYAKGWRYQ